MSQATETLLKQLKNPFDPKFVKWRVGATNADKTKGIALAYIDSREVAKRLDDVMGLDGWQKKLVGVDGGFTCAVLLKINDEWVGKENAAGNTKVEPLKGGASDAFKRAAADWGVGRYLYYLPNVWVPIKQQGNSYVLAEIPELPDWAKPGKVEDWQDVAEMEAAINSGADDLNVDVIVDNVDRIRAAQSTEELDQIVENIPADDRVVLANQIAAKKRELLHDEKINTDSSTSPSA